MPGVRRRPPDRAYLLRRIAPSPYRSGGKARALGQSARLLRRGRSDSPLSTARLAQLAQGSSERGGRSLLLVVQKTGPKVARLTDRAGGPAVGHLPVAHGLFRGTERSPIECAGPCRRFRALRRLPTLRRLPSLRLFLLAGQPRLSRGRSHRPHARRADAPAIFGPAEESPARGKARHAFGGSSPQRRQVPPPVRAR
jgi:hypothetical protein